MGKICGFWLLAALFLALPAQAGGLRQEPLSIETAAGARHAFTVEIAETPEEQERGLMFRRELAENAGMLFYWPGARDAAMWMKDTPLPLDMLFLDSGGVIVYIAADTTPYSTGIISAGRAVSAVLELPGGTARKLGIGKGDRVIHRYFAP